MATYGWTGKLLRVDLSRGTTDRDDTGRYTPAYIGGRGIAARIAWEEISPGTGALDPENLLMFMAGPLTGTSAPFSGRTEVCGLGPQGWPTEWFTRSGMGGHWSPGLKYAGWDGIIIGGRSEVPVYLLIRDGKVEIRDARQLWGKGIYETQQLLMAEHGRDVRVACIGQAGENLSRIAVISTETESSAGQGGFGAVMGSKRLKAIVVKGTGVVQVAQPEEFYRRAKAIAAECHAPHGMPYDRKLDPEMAKYKEKWQACTQGCNQKCGRYYCDVPGVVESKSNSGQFHCVAPLFSGWPGTWYSWKMSFEAGFEAARFSNDWGLNHWDLLLGLFPWLNECKKAGLLQKVDELPIDLNDPFFWAGVMRKITFGEGMGKVLSQGGWRAAKSLGLGEDLIAPLYTGWGYPGHWDGHGDRVNRIVYPFWLVSAVQWAVDTRDPMSSGHGYAQNLSNWSTFVGFEKALPWEKIVPLADRLYGVPSAFDPRSGYEGKAAPAYWHVNRSALKDSATVDDQMFPRIFSYKTPDGWARTEGADPIDGPDFERVMLTAATGVDWSAGDLDGCCDRIINVERAIQVRNFGRDRRDDESVIPPLARPENLVNPFVNERKALEPESFRKLLSEYYQMRGWDEATGRPTRNRLEMLNLQDVASELDSRGLLPG